MRLMKRIAAIMAMALVAITVLAVCDAALAQAPKPWEMDMQPAGNEIKRRIIALHDLVLIIITATTLFVGVLLVVVMVRFNEKANPIPSKTSHHTGLEIAWTVIPVVILIVMAVPSFRLIYFQDRTPNPDMTIKVVAHQWYWEYTYADAGNLNFRSDWVQDQDLKPGQKRLLEVDNHRNAPLNLQNEENVTVKYYRGQQSPVLSSSGFQRDMTYTIDPNTTLKTLTSFQV